MELIFNTVLLGLCLIGLFILPFNIMRYWESILELFILIIFISWNGYQLSSTSETTSTLHLLFKKCNGNALCILNNMASIIQLWFIIWLWIPLSRLFILFQIMVVFGMICEFLMYLFVIHQPLELATSVMSIPIVFAWFIGTVLLGAKQVSRTTTTTNTNPSTHAVPWIDYECDHYDSSISMCWIFCYACIVLQLRPKNVRYLIFSWPFFTAGAILQILSLVWIRTDVYNRWGNICLSLAIIGLSYVKWHWDTFATTTHSLSLPYEHISSEDDAVDVLVSTNDVDDSTPSTVYPSWINPLVYQTVHELGLYSSSMTACEWLLYLEEHDCKKSNLQLTLEQLNSLSDTPYETLHIAFKEWIQLKPTESQNSQNPQENKYTTHPMDASADATIHRIRQLIQEIPDFALQYLDQESKLFVEKRFSSSSSLCYLLSPNISLGKILFLLRSNLPAPNSISLQSQSHQQLTSSQLDSVFHFYIAHVLPLAISQPFTQVQIQYKDMIQQHWDVILQLESNSIQQIVMG